MTEPAISVVMPVYNGEKFLAEAIKSVLDQTYKDFELVIINDGSTDGSMEIARSFQSADPRIRVLQNPRNEGLVITRNRGLSEARGKYLAVLDADDVAHPHRLQLQAAFLDAHPEFAFVGSWAEFIDEQGVPTGRFWREKHSSEEFASVLLFNNCFAHSTITGRREIFLKEQYRPLFPPAEDYDLWVRIARKAPMAILPQVLARYRVHAKSTSSTARQQQSDSVTRIFSYQLSELGLPHGEREIAIHRILSECAFKPSKSLVHDCEAWLKQIKKANDHTALFAKEALAKVLSEKWLLVCGNSHLSLWALATYFRSPLRSIRRVPILDTAKLVVKCLTGFTGQRTADQPGNTDPGKP